MRTQTAKTLAGLPVRATYLSQPQLTHVTTTTADVHDVGPSPGGRLPCRVRPPCRASDGISPCEGQPQAFRVVAVD
jgi:hypothetical protein